MPQPAKRVPPKVRAYRAIASKIEEEICDRATEHLHATQRGTPPDGTPAEAAAPPLPPLDGLSDVNLKLEFQMRREDTIASRWTVYAVHTGPIAGVEGTGRDVTITGMTIQTLLDGTVARQVSYYDIQGLMQQVRSFSN